MYASILLMASMSVGQSPQFIALPPIIQTKSEEWVYYGGIGYKRVPVINGFVPSIREDVDVCGFVTVIYDYSKRIPYCSTRDGALRGRGNSDNKKVMPRLDADEGSNVKRNTTSNRDDELSEIRKSIAEIRKELAEMRKSTKEEGRRMPRIEDDDADNKPDRVPQPQKVPLPAKEKPKLPAAPAGMQRPSEIGDEKPKK